MGKKGTRENTFKQGGCFVVCLSVFKEKRRWEKEGIKKSRVLNLKKKGGGGAELREQVKSLNRIGEESIKPFQDIVFYFSVLEVHIESLTKNTGVIVFVSPAVAVSC